MTQQLWLGSDCSSEKTVVLLASELTQAIPHTLKLRDTMNMPHCIILYYIINLWMEMKVILNLIW